MLKKRNIFLILLIILNFAVAQASSFADKAKVKEGYLDAELAKDSLANSSTLPAKQNSTNAKKESRLTKRNQKEVIAKNSEKSAPSIDLNVPSADNNAKTESYSSDSWVPKIVKSDASKKQLEKYNKEQEKLVNELLQLNYNTYAPPKQLYDSASDASNKHLPPVYLKSDYFNMAFKAVEKDDENALRAALSGSNFLNQQNKDGDTILIHAVQSGSINSARILLAKSASVDIANNRQRTALHYAAALGNVDLVKLLLSMGAKPNLKDDMDMTPADYATLEENIQVKDMINKYIEAK